MSEGRYVVTSNAKINLTLGLLVALLGAIVTAAYNVGTWKREMELRVERLERERCPCREVFQTWPPILQK